MTVTDASGTAIRDAALHLITPAGSLHDAALLMHAYPSEWQVSSLRREAAIVRARLDELDAAMAAAAAINAAIGVQA